MKKHYRKEDNCLNCGATLQGKYCHVCGQENLEIKESFGHMMNHAISDYFHFDHQFFHTLKPLLFKPGFLTKEYMAGKRVQFLHPVKMYIFISVVYFLLLFNSGARIAQVNTNPDKKVPASGIVTGKKPAGNKSGIKRTKVDSGTVTVSNDTTLAQYHATQAKLPPEQRDGFVTRVFAEKLLSYNEEYGKHGGEHFVEDIQHNVPKMMFVLLPLFAVFLGITFRKNKKFYVEHLIYTFHFHCFVFLFASIILLIEMVLPGSWKEVKQWLSFAAFIYGLWYFYKSLKVVYERSRFRTITKMIGLSLADMGALIVCTTLLTFITALL
ncbi:MAG TPA: DUF3667 domain-containing protein [Mucilaginibacter sp.]|jgi:hypothetical protein|nr:DUF3667 domain-containing protein [Mucilaginibacter sp.]